MKNVAQFTTAAGLHIGIPTLGGLVVLDLRLSPHEGQPEGAKTVVRYIVAGGEHGRFAYLKDPYQHVVSKLPVSACGPWAHLRDKDGNAIAFPQKSIAAYEQTDEETFTVTLGIPTGPVEVALKTTLEELVEVGALDVSEVPGDIVAEELPAGTDGQDEATDEPSEGATESEG